MAEIHRWERGRAAIDGFLEQNHLARVPANREHAESLMSQARLHVDSARALRFADPGTAFSAAYDAGRKSLTAVLAIQGLRPTSKGGHIAVRDAALAQLDPPLGRLIKRYDWMRRTRNDQEYPSIDTPQPFTEDVDDAISIAAELIEKAGRMLEVLPPYGR